MELQFLFPDEILIKIFTHCDLPTLYNVMQVCHRFKQCASVQSMWKAKLLELTGWSANDKCLIQPLSTSYKDCCRRFSEIFGTNGMQLADVSICTHCHSLACTCNCGTNYRDLHDELIVFDFGSKTTWFKYTGDAGIGQLSMHPTIQPLTGSLASSDDLCPVCTKTFYRPSPPVSEEETASPRKSSKTFSKRSLRNLDCFSSSSSGDDDIALSSVDAQVNTSSITQQIPAVEPGDVRLFEFLMRHIIKRNPCFQISNIPFVICQSIDADELTKNKLVQMLICQFKVPEVCFIPKPVSVALYAVLDTCLVIDSGANNTVISPLVNLEVVTSAVKCIPVGGTHLSRLLLDCIRNKGVDGSITEAAVDSSQVKRECYIAYNIATESKKKIASKPVFIKAPRNGEARVVEVRLSHELYQAAENMYLSLDLSRVITDMILSLDSCLHRRLLSNIVMTGGNSRLNGLSLRLVRDLESLLPASLASYVHVIDPRLMTGRSDAVIGASYVRKWCHATWTTRRDYILSGVGDVSNCQTSDAYSLSDDTASVVSSRAAFTADDVLELGIENCRLNELSSDLNNVGNSSADNADASDAADTQCLDVISLCDEIVSSIL